MLSQAWDEVAAAYERYFVPRFAPWVDLVVAEVAERTLPEGLVAVPCCGTGPEIGRLAAAMPGREILGIDLSPEMIRLAGARSAGHRGVRFLVGDASTPGEAWASGCAAIVSAFGLQQIPEPDRALSRWAGALAPGGVLSVVLWPPEVEREGPFALLGKVLSVRLPPVDTSWESRLAEAAREGGAVLERDERRAFAMEHESAEAFWDAVTRSGPMRALALGRGEAFMQEAREAFLAEAPPGRITHAPEARWVVARRPAG